MKNLISSVRFAAVLALLGLLAARLPQGARAQGIEGVTITSIDVRYVGPETVSKDRVLANMRTKLGGPYSETTVEDDIRALYDTGKIQNVRIFGEPRGNGVHVQVILATRALITEIGIDGRRPEFQGPEAARPDQVQGAIANGRGEARGRPAEHHRFLSAQRIPPALTCSCR